MKNITLTQAEITALETAQIQYGTIITLDQLNELFNDNRGYLRKRVSKLIDQGWLTRIKNGTYALSDLSTRGSLSISHLAITNLLVDHAYVSFESALQYHGLYDQLLSKIAMVSLKQRQATKVDAYTYTFVNTQQEYYYGWQFYQVDGQKVKIADSEKALIDLIQFHRNRYTVDLVIEKLLNYKVQITLNRLINYALKTNTVTQRIMGFVLDAVSLESTKLFQAINHKQGMSILTKSKNNTYNSKWKLYYDEYFNQYTQ